LKWPLGGRIEEHVPHTHVRGTARRRLASSHRDERHRLDALDDRLARIGRLAHDPQTSDERPAGPQVKRHTAELVLGHRPRDVQHAIIDSHRDAALDRVGREIDVDVLPCVSDVRRRD